jgi:hypothetical protein
VRFGPALLVEKVGDHRNCRSTSTLVARQLIKLGFHV